jgi:hypothetical protein
MSIAFKKVNIIQNELTLNFEEDKQMGGYICTDEVQLLCNINAVQQSI